MEIKKSRRADLERGRGMRFVLGLVLVLALFFGAMEISFEAPQADADVDLLDELLREDDLIPLTVRQRGMPSVPAKKQPEAPERLTVADDELSEPLPEAPPSDTDGDSDSLPDGTDERPEPQPAEQAVANASTNPDVLRVVENLPEFPGGATELMRWLTDNLRYPKAAQLRKVQGKVVVQFIVNADGSLTDMKIVTSLSPECDRETMRVMAMMPAWKAGMQDGRPCRTMVAIPVVFKL